MRAANQLALEIRRSASLVTRGMLPQIIAVLFFIFAGATPAQALPACSGGYTTFTTTAKITAPAAGTVYAPGVSSVTVTFTITGGPFAPPSVQLITSNGVITTVSVPTAGPFTATFSGLTAGTYTLAVIPTVPAIPPPCTLYKIVNASEGITITSPQPPSVSISAVAPSATQTYPATFTFTSSATAVQGSIQSVTYYVNGTATSAALTAAPYSFAWASPAKGSYTITARAVDTFGLSTTSQAITVQATGHLATRTSIFAYDANGLLQKEVSEPTTSALCVATDYVRDSYGNVQSSTVRNCNGSTTTLSGASVSEPAALVTGSPALFASRKTSTTYDAQGRFPATITNPLLQTESRSYDSRWGGMTSLTGPNHLTTKWSFDTLGRKQSETRADGSITSISVPGYYGVGSIPVSYEIDVTTTDSTGAVTLAPLSITEYDQFDRVVRHYTDSFDPAVDGTYFVDSETYYDAVGRIVTKNEPHTLADTAMSSTSNAYDVLGRLISTVDPLNNEIDFTYSGLISNTYTAVAATTKTINVNGQLTSVIDGNGTTTSFSYDPEGNLTTTTVNGVVVNSAAYDLKGRKTSSTDSDMGTWTYTFDALGQLVQQVDSNYNATLHTVANTTTLTYDLLGRMLTRTESDLTSYWEYDVARTECGASTNAAIGKPDRAWTSTTYNRIACYDSLGRSVKQIETIGTPSYTSTVAYDASSRVLSTTFPSGFAVKNGYDANGYFVSVANNANVSQIFWTANEFDAYGHVTKETMGNGAKTTRTFVNASGLHNGLPFDIVTMPTTGTTPIQNEAYAYDQLNNLSSRSWTSGTTSHSESFTYDVLNRLQGISGAMTASFTYDVTGNITSKSDVGGTYTYGNAATPHRLTSISGATVNGVANPQFTYDARGNQLTGPNTTISWMSFNMPTAMTVSGVTDSFLYGPEHQRIQQISGTVTTNYAGPQGFEAVISGGATSYRNYVYAGGALIAQVNTTAAAPTTIATINYYHRNNQGSTVAITDAAGNLTAQYSYDAWGKRRNADGTPANITSAVVTPGYDGQEQLDNIGLVHMNGRVYNPVTGRFISADPMISAAGYSQSWNRYAYVVNNPLTLTDPSGFCWVCDVVSDVVNAIDDTINGLLNGIGSAATTTWHSPTGRAAIAIGVGWELSFADLGFGGAGLFGATGSEISAASFGNALASAFAQGAIGSGSLDGGFNGVSSAAVFYALAGPGDGGFADIANHAVAGCLSAKIGGGNCGNGALSAAVSEAALPYIQGQRPVVQLFEESALGGTTSVIGGGKFANGALTAAYGYMFNHCGPGDGGSCFGAPFDDGASAIPASQCSCHALGDAISWVAGQVLGGMQATVDWGLGIIQSVRAGADNQPNSSLPRDQSGNYLPDPAAEGAHTTLGTRQGSNGGSYTQGATFDPAGNFEGRTDVTDHNRGDHTDPHFHPATGPNSVGPAKPIPP